VISAAENSNKFQKNRFWKEKSVENVITLMPTAYTTLLNSNPTNITGFEAYCLGVFKCQNNIVVV
jgi:hypothetical protein